jgi:hypothetical protein
MCSGFLLDHVPLDPGSPVLTAGFHKIHCHGIAVEELSFFGDGHFANVTLSN